MPVIIIMLCSQDCRRQDEQWSKMSKRRSCVRSSAAVEPIVVRCELTSTLYAQPAGGAVMKKGHKRPSPTDISCKQ